MADLTAVSTFNYSLQGNRRVYSVDVGVTGASTSDTVSVPCSAIVSIISGSYLTTVFGSSMSVPYLAIGSSANTVQILRSSDGIALPVRFTVEGR